MRLPGAGEAILEAMQKQGTDLLRDVWNRSQYDFHEMEKRVKKAFSDVEEEMRTKEKEENAEMPKGSRRVMREKGLALAEEIVRALPDTRGGKREDRRSARAEVLEKTGELRKEWEEDEFAYRVTKSIENDLERFTRTRSGKERRILYERIFTMALLLKAYFLYMKDDEKQEGKKGA